MRFSIKTSPLSPSRLFLSRQFFRIPDLSLIEALPGLRLSPGLDDFRQAPPGSCVHLIRVGLHTRPFLAPSRPEPKADELEDGAELLNGLGFDVRADLTPKQGLDRGLVVATEADEGPEISPGQHDRSHRCAVDDADEEPTVL